MVRVASNMDAGDHLNKSHWRYLFHLFICSGLVSASQGAAARNRSIAGHPPTGRKHGAAHLRSSCFGAPLHHEGSQQLYNVSAATFLHHLGELCTRDGFYN